MAGTAYVGTKVVMEGELMAQIVKTENKENKPTMAQAKQEA
jgi:hypothetical protein